MEKVKFHLSAEQLSTFPYSEEPITLREMRRSLESLADPSCVKHLSGRVLPLWLVSIGLLHPPRFGEAPLFGRTHGGGQGDGDSLDGPR